MDCAWATRNVLSLLLANVELKLKIEEGGSLASSFPHTFRGSIEAVSISHYNTCFVARVKGFFREKNVRVETKEYTRDTSPTCISISLCRSFNRGTLKFSYRWKEGTSEDNG